MSRRPRDGWPRRGVFAFHPFHDVLLGDARRHLDDGEQRVAVILCHAAAEAYIAQAWTVVLLRRASGRVEELLDRVDRDLPFSPDEAQGLWKTHTGESIKEPNTVWEPWRRSVRLRNALVHGRAVPCERRDAEASMRAVEEFIARIERVVAPLRLPA